MTDWLTDDCINVYTLLTVTAHETDIGKQGRSQLQSLRCYWLGGLITCIHLQISTLIARFSPVSICYPIFSHTFFKGSENGLWESLIYWEGKISSPDMPLELRRCYFSREHLYTAALGEAFLEIRGQIWGTKEIIKKAQSIVFNTSQWETEGLHFCLSEHKWFHGNNNQCNDIGCSMT